MIRFDKIRQLIWGKKSAAPVVELNGTFWNYLELKSEEKNRIGTFWDNLGLLGLPWRKKVPTPQPKGSREEVVEENELFCTFSGMNYEMQ